jgi:type II secretory pathway pseudopilin PulG
VRRTEGLTIIEVLIALSLLGVMTSLIVSSLTGSFALTRDSRRTLDATTGVQRILEEIRGQWRQRGFYNAGCVKNLNLNPTNAAYLSVSAESQQLELGTTTNPTVSVLPVTAQTSQVIGTSGCQPTAAQHTATCVSEIRRVRVITTNPLENNRELARVELDIACPNR